MKLSDSAVVFCDNHLLVALKPNALPTQPPPEGGDSLEGFAKEWLKRSYQKPGNVFLHAIHRLDKPVSGLVLFARTSKALSRLNEQQREQSIQRVYAAEVEGALSIKKGKLDHYLIHGEHRAIVAKADEPNAKHARLTYTVFELRERSTVVVVELETGRYHQIRAQFGASGYPIIGDRRYGAKGGDERAIHLHCMRLAFEHPVTKERCSFHSSAPFSDCLSI